MSLVLSDPILLNGRTDSARLSLSASSCQTFSSHYHARNQLLTLSCSLWEPNHYINLCLKMQRKPPVAKHRLLVKLSRHQLVRMAEIVWFLRRFEYKNNETET